MPVDLPCKKCFLKSFLQRRKIIQVRNSDLHKERKSIKEGVSEGKIKNFLLKKNLFVFIFGRVGSLLLRMGFL